MSEGIEEEFVGRHDRYRRKSVNEGHNGIRSGYHEGGFTDPADSVRRMRAEVADSVTITADDRVLDIGCAFGDCLVWLASEIGASGLGVDIAEPHLDVARNLAKEHGVGEQVKLKQGDFHELSSFVTEPVDVVWATESLMYTSRTESVIDEIASVLEEGGRFVMGDAFLQQDELTSKQQDRLKIIRRGDRAHYDNIHDIEDHLREDGFTVERHKITKNVRPELSRITTFARLYRPLFNIGYRLGLVSADRRDSLSVPIATDKLFENDVLEYYILTARL